MKIFFGDQVMPGGVYWLGDKKIAIDYIFKDADQDRVITQLRAGHDPDNVMTEGHSIISYEQLKRVSFDVVRLDVTLIFVNAKGEDEEKSLMFFEREAFKKCYQAMQTALAARFTEVIYKPNAPQAAWGGLFFASILLFFTAVLSRMAAQMLLKATDVSDEGWVTRLLFLVVKLLGEAGVLVVGGSLTLLAVAYGVTRVTKKSGYRIFQATPFKAPGLINTLLKYLGLAFFVFFALRIFLS